jgi:SAM-dependent methyltransferase
MRFLSRVIPCQIMVDLCCGGGWTVIRQKSQYVLGIDTFRPALKKAKQIYNEVILADANFLPLRSDYVDCLISMDVFAHIPFNRKDRVIHEIDRILKKSCYTYHLVETDGLGVIPSLMKQFPLLYTRYMVDLDGHVGLEIAESVQERFKNKFGSNVKATKFSSGLFWPAASYLRRLDKEYKKRFPMHLRFLINLSRFCSRSPFLVAVIDCVFGCLSRVHDIFTTFNDADCVYIVAQKR